MPSQARRAHRDPGAVPFSRTTSHLATELTEVSASSYPGSLRQPRHGHDAAYFTLVLSGAYDERIGRRQTEVGAGRLIFHPAGEEHAVSFRAPETRVVRLLPQPSLLEAAAMLRVDLSAPLPGIPLAKPAMERLVAASARRSVEAPLEVDELACEFLAVLAHDHSLERRASTALAHLAREMIDAEPTCVRGLSAFAKEVSCHPITLARAFRRVVGCSVAAYSRRARLRFACDLLRRRVMSISMVAATCGFADQAHLTRSLRRATGRTPGEIVAAG